MTARETFSRSGRGLVVLAVTTTLGAVLLGVGLTSAGQQPSGGSDDDPARFTSEVPAAARVSRGLVVRPRPVLPTRLEIPAIDVATSLVRLGLMKDGTVEVPSDPDLAGWFRHGPPPGQRGSAVILGHVDSVQGPAVFARLQELRPGDAVTVGRQDGSVARFVVRKAVLYANEDFPAHRVYAARAGHGLNLVTCGGTYDATDGGYQSNLVVYTRRAPSV